MKNMIFKLMMLTALRKSRVSLAENINFITAQTACAVICCVYTVLFDRFEAVLEKAILQC